MLSETCARLVSTHTNSTCPTLDKLIPFDTSNQHVSGKFIKVLDHWIRTPAQLKNNYKYYSTIMNKSAICVECVLPLGSPDLIKMIIIEPHLDTFISKYDSLKNYTMTTYHTRYMAGCNTANISYSPSLLNDTIFYMQHDCQASATSYNNTNTKVLPNVMKLDYGNYVYTHQHWLDSIKQNHGYQDCIHKHCNIKSEGHKW